MEVLFSFSFQRILTCRCNEEPAYFFGRQERGFGCGFARLRAGHLAALERHRRSIHYRSASNPPSQRPIPNTKPILTDGWGRWIRPPAGGPGRRENVPPARFLTRLPFESTFTNTHTKQKTCPFGQVFCLVGEGGFEPPKALPADLQSVPFGHSGIPPYSILRRKGGAGGRIRTPDLLITNQLLYLLSYTSVTVQPAYNSKCRRVCQYKSFHCFVDVPVFFLRVLSNAFVICNRFRGML